MSVNTLQELGETKTFAKSRIIFNEGEPGDSMYIILKGKVGIYIGYNLVKELNAGEFFGEMSLLENQPRSATVKAETDVIVLKVDGDNIEPLIASHPKIAFKMLKGLSQRISLLNEQLYK